ncbi:MAG: MoaD/ThiS family protein [Sedimenticolaceae bacterium]
MPAAERRIKVLYFAYLASKMRKESEELTPPDTVADVQQLLAWLRRVKGDRGYLLADENIRVTVNKQFAEPFTRLDPGDEVAIVPNSPNPPPPPKPQKRQNDDW